MTFKNEKNQMLTTVLWLQFVSEIEFKLKNIFQTWNDYKMQWTPEEYGNITQIAVPTGFLWRPDVLLFNSADENFDARFDVNYVVNFQGNVLQAPPALIKSSCMIDITW